MYETTPRKRAYSRWRQMIARCTNPRHVGWKNYGGRGITVCDRWLASFDAYYEDVNDPPFDGATIDRIDNDGDYTCGQCPDEIRNWRWATRQTQSLNRRPYVSFESKKTHCPAGHAYDEQNTYVAPTTGHRTCRACALDRDRVRHNWSGKPYGSSRTECPQGHPYDEANTYRSPDGHRSCKKCRAAASARHRARTIAGVA